MEKECIYCCKCEKKVMAVAITGQDIYPHRPDLYEKIFFQCPTCKNYVGTHKVSKHPQSGQPLGSIPTPELRKLRYEIHSLLDPLWRNKFVSRDFLYNHMSNVVQREFHVSQINSEEEARLILEEVKTVRDKFQAEFELLEEIKNFEL